MNTQTPHTECHRSLRDRCAASLRTRLGGIKHFHVLNQGDVTIEVHLEVASRNEGNRTES